MSEPTTVRDIEWHVSIEYPGWIFAEDQGLLFGGAYAQQIVDEHNQLQALKQRLHDQQHHIEVDYDGTDANAYQGPVPDVL